MCTFSSDIKLPDDVKDSISPAMSPPPYFVESKATVSVCADSNNFVHSEANGIQNGGPHSIVNGKSLTTEYNNTNYDNCRQCTNKTLICAYL